MRQITALMMAATVVAVPGWASASTPVSVTGAVQTSLTLDAEQLQLPPAQTQTVGYGSGAGARTHNYKGAGLWQVLSAVGVALNPADVRASGSAQAGVGGVSSSFSVTGQVNKAASFDLAALQALPVTTTTAGEHLHGRAPVGFARWRRGFEHRVRCQERSAGHVRGGHGQ